MDKYKKYTVDPTKEKSAGDNWEAIWVWNSAQNLQFILEHLQTKTLTKLEKEPLLTNKRVLITASGTSLEKLKKVKLSKDVYLMACLSHTTTLLQWNIIPDAITMIDSNAVAVRYIQDVIKMMDEKKITKIPKLFVSSVVDPGVLKEWNNRPIVMFIPKAAQPSRFHDFFLPVVYSKRYIISENKIGFENIFHDGIINSGCTPNGSIHIANFLKAKHIYILGYDLCFNKKQRRCTTYEYKNEKLVEKDNTYLDKIKKLVTENGQIITEEMALYKKEFYLTYLLTEVPIENLSKISILHEIPYKDIRVLENEKDIPIENKNIIKKIIKKLDDYGLEVRLEKRGTLHMRIKNLTQTKGQEGTKKLL